MVIGKDPFESHVHQNQTRSHKILNLTELKGHVCQLFGLAQIDLTCFLLYTTYCCLLNSCLQMLMKPRNWVVKAHQSSIAKSIPEMFKLNQQTAKSVVYSLFSFYKKKQNKTKKQTNKKNKQTNKQTKKKKKKKKNNNKKTKTKQTYIQIVSKETI